MVDYGLKIIQKANGILKSLAGGVCGALDVKDFFIFGGLAMLGYGLYLLRPWIAFTVCGGLVMILGCLMTEKS
jgi:hypothetical protein